MSFSLTSSAGPSQEALMMSPDFPDAPDVAPPDPQVTSDILAQEPPEPVNYGSDSREWRRCLADVMHAQHRLQDALLRKNPWIFYVVSDRFQRYDALTAALSKLLPGTFGKDKERFFVEKIHQFRIALWSLSQLLRQAHDPSIPLLLQEISGSVNLARRLLRQLEDEQPPSASTLAMRHQLEHLLFSLDRCSTLESCRSAMAALDTRRRHLQQEYVTQRLLSGSPSIAPASIRPAPWERTSAPQDVQTMQSTYGAPRPSSSTPPHLSRHPSPYLSLHSSPHLPPHLPPWLPPPYSPAPYVQPSPVLPAALSAALSAAPDDPSRGPSGAPAYALRDGASSGAAPVRSCGTLRSPPEGPARGYTDARTASGRLPSPEDGRVPSPQTVRLPAPQADPHPTFLFSAEEAVPLESLPMTVRGSPTWMFQPDVGDGGTGAVAGTGQRDGEAGAPQSGPAPLQLPADAQAPGKRRARRSQLPDAARLQGTTAGTTAGRSAGKSADKHASTKVDTKVDTEAGTESTKLPPRRKRPAGEVPGLSTRLSAHTVISTVKRLDVRTVVQRTSTSTSTSITRPRHASSYPPTGWDPDMVTLVFPRSVAVPLEASPLEDEPLVMEVFEEPIPVEDECSSSSTSSQGT